MKYKLTDKAKKMTSNEFAINYGVNIYEAVKAFECGEVDVTKEIVIAGLRIDKMIVVETKVTDHNKQKAKELVDKKDLK